MELKLIYLLSTLLGMVLTFAVLILVLRKGSNSLTLSLFCIYVTLSGLLPSFFEILTVFAPTATWFLISNDLFFGSLIMFPVSLILFVLYFTGKKEVLLNYFFTMPVILLTVLLLNVVWLSDLIFIHDISKFEKYTWGYLPGQGSFVHLIEIWIGIWISFAVVLLIKFALKQRDMFIRKQSFLMVAGLVIPFILSMVNYSFLPVMNIIPFPAVGFLNAITVSFLGYAIIKHGLFSFDLTSVSGNVVQVINGSVIAMDKAGNIFMVNKFTQRLLGFSESELTQKNIVEILPQIDFDSFINKIMLKTGGPVNEGAAINLVTKEGKQVPVNGYISSIDDKFGNQTGFVFFGVDISGLKEKSELIEKNSQLIKKQNEEFEKLNKMMINRELKMIELKEENRRLQSQLNKV